MQSRWLAVLGSTSLFVCALGVDSCASEDVVAADDAPDASSASPRDSAVYFPDAEAPCDPDADLLEGVRDAEIADGASTTGICASCMKAACAEQLAGCSENCPCQGIMGDTIDCYLSTQNIACLGRLTNYLVTAETRSKALQVAGCARTSCASACAVDAGLEADAGAADGS